MLCTCASSLTSHTRNHIFFHARVENGSSCIRDWTRSTTDTVDRDRVRGLNRHRRQVLISRVARGYHVARALLSPCLVCKTALQHTPHLCRSILLVRLTPLDNPDMLHKVPAPRPTGTGNPVPSCIAVAGPALDPSTRERYARRLATLYTHIYSCLRPDAFQGIPSCQEHLPSTVAMGSNPALRHSH
jgi:hypothetical protein